MPIGPARMPLFDHLGELRVRLVRIVACLGIAVCVFYFAAPTVSNILTAPVSEFMDSELVAFTPFESFAVRFKLAFWVSLLSCSPIIIWQILAFFLPALKPSERRWFIPTFSAAVALFLLGTVFCYFIILPPAFQWLLEQAGGFGTILPNMSSYIDTIIKFELGFGFAFELPLIIFYLVIFDVVPYKKLRGSWRTVYVVLMVISAVVTPDASPITMLLMFAAMVALYEGSLLISRVVLAKRIKKQNAQLAEEERAEAEEAAKAAKRAGSKGLKKVAK